MGVKRWKILNGETEYEEVNLKMFPKGYYRVTSFSYQKGETSKKYVITDRNNYL